MAASVQVEVWKNSSRLPVHDHWANLIVADKELAPNEAIRALVPEYLGTAATYFDADTVDLDGLEQALEARGLLALEPAPAEDVNVVVVTEQTARDLELEAVSDLTAVAPGMTFGGPVECPERPLCLIGLRETYGIVFADFVPQRSLAITAEALRRGEIDAGMMFSTSGEFVESEFVMLTDDLQLQPPENIVPIHSGDAHERWGAVIEPALDELSASLTTRSVRAMNVWIADDQAVADVAGWWLEGLRTGDA